MECLHPTCPLRDKPGSWHEVVERVCKRQRDKIPLYKILVRTGGLHEDSFSAKPDWPNEALAERLFGLCPCLYAQFSHDDSNAALGITHLCAITIGERINSLNAKKAFAVQHPSEGRAYKYPPIAANTSAGNISEAFCSEILENEGISHMEFDEEGWPQWESEGHVSLNAGKFHRVKTYGDILIPAAPTNILISVKTETTKERLMVSGNRFESIGFGFFTKPEEFWSHDKPILFRRMGFAAIYMPTSTYRELSDTLEERKIPNVNINGTELYRPITRFGTDMRRVAGKVSLDL